MKLYVIKKSETHLNSTKDVSMFRVSKKPCVVKDLTLVIAGADVGVGNFPFSSSGVFPESSSKRVLNNVKNIT